MNYKIFKDTRGLAATNSYLVYDEVNKKGFIIDANGENNSIEDKIDELNLKVEYLFITHGHWDHIISAEHLRDKYNLKIVAHRESDNYLSNPFLNGSLSIPQIKDYSFKSDIKLDDEGTFEIFEYFYVPGHTYDHLVYRLKNIVFTGDLIFRGTVGRTDFPGSKHQDLENSIQNIIYRKFNDDTILLPGHGDYTTVAYEKVNNPWVPFKE